MPGKKTKKYQTVASAKAELRAEFTGKLATLRTELLGDLAAVHDTVQLMGPPFGGPPAPKYPRAFDGGRDVEYAPGKFTELTPSEVANGVRVLEDGTKQWPEHPVGTNVDGSVINAVPNQMQVPGPEWGAGALVKTKGLQDEAPHTVVAVSGWGVRAELPLGNGAVHTIELPIDQLDLLRPAP